MIAKPFLFGLGLGLSLALFAAGAARADEDTAAQSKAEAPHEKLIPQDPVFGPKPWIGRPSGGSDLLTAPTPERKLRRSIYRSNIERELRVLELSPPTRDLRAIDRLNSLRGERLRQSR